MAKLLSNADCLPTKKSFSLFLPSTCTLVHLLDLPFLLYNWNSSTSFAFSYERKSGFDFKANFYSKKKYTDFMCDDRAYRDASVYKRKHVSLFPSKRTKIKMFDQKYSNESSWAFPSAIQHRVGSDLCAVLEAISMSDFARIPSVPTSLSLWSRSGSFLIKHGEKTETRRKYQIPPGSPTHDSLWRMLNIARDIFTMNIFLSTLSTTTWRWNRSHDLDH